MWNVKFSPVKNRYHHKSINRNIVECKGKMVQEGKNKEGAGINRNIVECKVDLKFIVASLLFVLIETLWNVKSESTGLLVCGVRRINRNLVECKERKN